MNSFDKIDYRLRPAKHAERTMMIELYRSLRFLPTNEYQYVSFGSVAFIDFRMVHRMLGISNMISIEGTNEPEAKIRFGHNKPFAGIDLRFGHSNAVLPTLDFTKPSIVWLDYDGHLARSMANDVATVAREAASGTFIGVTFSRYFPTEDDERTAYLTRLKEEFPEFVPDDAKPLDYDGIKLAEFGRTVLGALLNNALSNADAGKQPDEKRAAFQVCNFRYRDGVPMVTIGWVIADGTDTDVLADCRLSDLSFYRDSDRAFGIKPPIITPYEVREMEKHLPDEDQVHTLTWIPEADRKSFLKIYRFLPHFAVLEPV